MRRGCALAATVLLVAAAPLAQAAERPFSFLERPTDQLAVPGYVAGTTVTPEGYLYTGYAELVFRHGPRLRPLRAPLRQLVGGRYPVVRYSQRSGSVRYTVTAFTAEVGARPVNFVRVEARNAGARPATAAWAVALRDSGGSSSRTAGARSASRGPCSRRGPACTRNREWLSTRPLAGSSCRAR